MNKKLSNIAAIIFLMSLATGLLAVTLPMTSAATYPAWDFEDHGLTHTNVTTMNTSTLVNELTTVNTIFASQGLPTPRHFAYPDGVFDDSAIATIMQYRDTCRTAGAGAPFPMSYPVSAANWYRASAVNIDQNKTFENVKTWIDNAIASKSLAIIFTHNVGTPAPTYGTTPEILQSVVNYLVQQQTAGNLSVMTMKQAYTGFNGQKAVVVMAFDDDTTTDYTVVWPIFKAAGLAGTSFIVSNWVGVIPNTMTWLQIKEMAQVGEFAPIQRPIAIAWALNVNSTVGGNTSVPVGYWQTSTSTITVRAFPQAGYNFTYWLLDGVALAGNPLTVPTQTYGTFHYLTAVFNQSGVTPAANWTLTVNSTVGGTTSQNGTIVSSGTIRINATAAANYTFSSWQFDGRNLTSTADTTAFSINSTNTTSTITVPQQTASTNHTLTAIFANASTPVTPTVWSITVNSTSGGNTTVTGTMNVTGSTKVNATAAANYTFSNWRFDNVNLTAPSDITKYNITWTNTTSTITVPAQNASSNHTLTAVFVTPTVWSLSVNSSIGGNVSRTGAMNITGTVALTATANANYTFSYWQFDGLNVTAPADLTRFQVVSGNSTSTITIPMQLSGSSHTLMAVFADRSSS